MSSSPSPSILTEAQKIVSGPRQEAYGHPRDNHGRTARLWSAYFGFEITPEQVCWANVLQKLSRQMHAPGRDNLVDAVGFIANIQLLQEAEPDDVAAAILHMDAMRRSQLS